MPYYYYYYYYYYYSLSQYSDWLRTGSPRGRGLSSVGGRVFASSPMQYILGVLSPGIERPESEADHSPPTNAQVKKMWIYTSNSPYIFVE
jgi:hypothetical protein